MTQPSLPAEQTNSTSGCSVLIVSKNVLYALAVSRRRRTLRRTRLRNLPVIAISSPPPSGVSMFVPHEQLMTLAPASISLVSATSEPKE